MCAYISRRLRDAEAHELFARIGDEFDDDARRCATRRAIHILRPTVHEGLVLEPSWFPNSTKSGSRIKILGRDPWF
eukprot:gene796-biopygen956